MSYDYERYDGKRIVVDGDVIGLLAMEFGHEVEEVWEEHHAELAMTEEQERQSEAYKESLRRALSAQYEKVATLETQNAKLRELCADLYAEMITYSNTPNYNASVWAPKLRELGIEVDDLERRIDELCEENAKLRELLSSLWKRGHSPAIPNVERDYLSEMRELGVEV